MKKALFLLILPLLFISGCVSGQQKSPRHFFIGYIGTDETNTVFDGGDSITVWFYPNVFILADHYAKKHNLRDVRILSITEQTNTEYYEFWYPHPDRLTNQINYFKTIRK